MVHVGRDARAMRGFLLGLGAAAVCVPLALAAGVPHTFANGAVADASEVNQNFAALAVTGVVGDVRHSMLTEAQLQAEVGTGWVLSDGRNVAGSRYAAITGRSTVPDLRGLVLRGRNNGRNDGLQNPDGELALGAYQADAFKAHYHLDGYDDTALTGKFGKEDAGARTGRYGHSDSGSAGGNQSAKTSTVGANETRVRNATVNIFIRIN